MRTPDDTLVAGLDELVVLSDPAVHPRVVALLERLGAGDLRVALVGEAKRGKSTLGNALLGAAVLPTGVVPVTAVSTEVRAGSPRGAIVEFDDGSTLSTDVCEVERFVTERHNAHNYRHVRCVRIQLPTGMPHPRMVLVDTPGVGSVHRHNTEVAQKAFASMDAAVFVLTADPPISASELALFEQVAERAVRVFVVLNKADQLTPAELGEATAFVREVVAGAPGGRPEIWVCSARNGLDARVSRDTAAWAASGVPAFLDALLAHLVENRERDLRVSIATAAARIAGQQLDGVLVTLAAVKALDAEQEHRVRELAVRLDAIDQRRAQAVAYVTADLTQQRARLDAHAAAEIGRVTRQVRERLAAFLATADRLAAAGLEEQGRGVIAETTQAAVEAWRTRWHDRLNDAVNDLRAVEQGLLEEAAGDLRAAVRDLLGVQLQTEAPVLTPPTLPTLHYDFGPDIGWNQALVSGLRTHAPLGVGRRRVAHHLQSEADRLVDKHIGRARADFQSRIEETGRRFRAQVADAFTGLTESLRAGHQAALEMQGNTVPGHSIEPQRLERLRSAFEELAQRLREVTAEPGAEVRPPEPVEHRTTPASHDGQVKEETR